MIFFALRLCASARLKESEIKRDWESESEK